MSMAKALPHKELMTLTYSRIRLNKKMVNIFIIFIFLTLLIPIACATNYSVRPSINKEPGVSADDEKIQELDPLPYWVYLLLWVFPQLIAMSVEALLSIKVFLYLGYTKIKRKNILDNNIRLTIYNFIKEHPGVYLRELVKKTDLKKGTVEYHLKIMKTQNMIVSHKANGKVHYFLNNRTYDKKDQAINAILKNDMLRMILLEILSKQYINNKTLAEKMGVSAATISYHIGHLKEEGIIRYDLKGKYKIYSIDPSYFDSLQKCIDSTNSSVNQNKSQSINLDAPGFQPGGRDLKAMRLCASFE